MSDSHLHTSTGVLGPDHDVEAELVYAAYDQLRMSLVMTAAVVVIFGGLLWLFFPPALMTAWVLAVLAIVAVRFVLWAAFQRAAPAPNALARWGRYFLLGSMLAGAGWAIGPTLMIRQAGGAELALLIGTLLSVCAVAIGAQATQQAAMHAFVFTALVPPAIAAWRTGGDVEQMVALVIVVALACLILVGRRSGQAIRALLETQSRMRTILDTAMDAVIRMDAQGQITDWNLRAEFIFGRSRNEVLGMAFHETILPVRHRETQRRALARFLATGEHEAPNRRIETTAMRRNGEEFPVEMAITLLRSGGTSSFTAFIVDITERKQAVAALWESEKLLRESQSVARLGSYVLDVSTGIWSSSVILDEIFGIDDTFERSVSGWLSLVHPEWRDRMTRYLEDDVLGEHVRFDREYRIIRMADGEARWVYGLGELEFDAQGRPLRMFGTITDITERKQAEEKINELAFFDQLTGLPNRNLLLDRLRQTMTGSSRNGSYGALLLIDLDRFKTVNDTLGHDMGDLLLQQVAQRLTTIVREGDTVARLGGDEFVVMLASLSLSEEDAATQTEVVGEKLLAVLNQTYQLKDVAYHSTPSIGAILFSGHQTEIDILLKQADLAMYRSKTAGRNALRFFDPDMEIVVLRRAALEKDLREAVRERQFLLYYQAQVVGEGRVTGAEALVRWRHPERGIVSPADFIPLAEETGLILPLGHWVLEAACRQLVAWAAQPRMAHLTVAVNVSAHQFRQPDFVQQVLAVFKRTGVNPARLKLELTESILVEKVQDVIEKMSELKTKGVGFALDDFGTGYSSLSYLKRLPLDQLKIDQSFVREVLSDPNGATIAKTIIALAQSLGLDVIAEGVESEAQLNFLASSGCHAYQGYFFSWPSPLLEFEEFVLRV